MAEIGAPYRILTRYPVTDDRDCVVAIKAVQAHPYTFETARMALKVCHRIADHDWEHEGVTHVVDRHGRNVYAPVAGAQFGGDDIFF